MEGTLLGGVSRSSAGGAPAMEPSVAPWLPVHESSEPLNHHELELNAAVHGQQHLGSPRPLPVLRHGKGSQARRSVRIPGAQGLARAHHPQLVAGVVREAHGVLGAALQAQPKRCVHGLPWRQRSFRFVCFDPR